MPYHNVNNNFYKARGINSNLNQFVVDYFYESINNNKD